MTTIFVPMSLAAILLPIRCPGLTDANPGRCMGRNGVRCVYLCVCVCVCVEAQLEAWSLGLGAIPLATEQAYRGRGRVTRCRKTDDAATGRVYDWDMFGKGASLGRTWRCSIFALVLPSPRRLLVDLAAPIQEDPSV
ncbi:hypothetical protein CGRA01v4_09436 [Colletotrichum graminicola]|nr:hypothetical protein CGRA01v4_09436 [Colletotrichum graminicola]